MEYIGGLLGSIAQNGNDQAQAQGKAVEKQPQQMPAWVTELINANQQRAGLGPQSAQQAPAWAQSQGQSQQPALWSQLWR